MANSGSIRFLSSEYTGSQNSFINISAERYDGSETAATASVYVSSSSNAIAGVDYEDIFPYTLYWSDGISGSQNFSIRMLAPWSDSKTLNLYLSNLTNIESGSIMDTSILIAMNIITQSLEPLEEVSKDYTINSYGNFSSRFNRRIEQVPFYYNRKGTGRTE